MGGRGGGLGGWWGGGGGREEEEEEREEKETETEDGRPGSHGDELKPKRFRTLKQSGGDFQPVVIKEEMTLPRNQR